MSSEYKCNISSENIVVIDKYLDVKEHINPFKFVIVLNDNKPAFTDEEKRQIEREGYHFSDIDERRCGMAFACISKTTLTNPRDSRDKRPKIHSKPSGFPESKEENTINEKLIFQRCHLIGYQLYKLRNDKGCENANLKGIFTGTRFMNNVMFYYEQIIYKYVDKSEKHVLYRVTPYFKGNNKLVYGVQMEAMFINESGNEDIKSSFNVFVYNKQPYIGFNYETGKDLSDKMFDMEYNYVIDKEKRKFHIDGCASIWNFADDRKEIIQGKRAELIQKYHPCGICDLEIKKKVNRK